MVNFEFITAMFPTWVMVPFLFMILSGLLSTVDSLIVHGRDKRDEKTKH